MAQRTKKATEFRTVLVPITVLFSSAVLVTLTVTNTMVVRLSLWIIKMFLSASAVAVLR